MKTCHISRATCFVLLTGVFAVQNLQPALRAWISAPSVNEVLVQWEPPIDPSQVKYYNVKTSNNLKNKEVHYNLRPKVTSHLLDNLTDIDTYSISIWWTGSKNTQSTKKNFTVVPQQLYRNTTEKRSRPRPPAILIFYGCIGAAVFLYVIVVFTLIVFACKRRRNNATLFINLSDPERRSAIREDSDNECSQTERYSKTEDLQLNRISTFTGRRVTSNRITTDSDDVCEGYIRPVSTGYLHPIAALEMAPELPTRNQSTYEDEHHVYQEPDMRYDTDMPEPRSNNSSTGTKNEKKTRKKAKLSSKSFSLGKKHKKKMDMTSASGTQTIGRHNSMNAISDVVVIPSNTMVQRNESMRSVTVRTAVDDIGGISCPDIPGISDSIQITLTFMPKPGNQQ